MQFVLVQQGATGGGVQASIAPPGTAAAASLAMAAAESTTLAVEDAFAHAFARVADEQGEEGEAPAESGAVLHGMLAAFYQYIDDDIHVHTPVATAGEPGPDGAPQAASCFCRWTPMPWPGGGNVTVARVALGAHHTLAVAQDGALWSWGRNESGQTGDAQWQPQQGPVRQEVLQCGGDFADEGGRSHRRRWGGGQGQWLAADVAAGREHSLLLTRTGEVTHSPQRIPLSEPSIALPSAPHNTSLWGPRIAPL
jgi:hypothetical protein